MCMQVVAFLYDKKYATYMHYSYTFAHVSDKSRGRLRVPFKIKGFKRINCC